jgi:putative redox protein
MEALVKWLGKGTAFEGVTKEGHRFILAGPPELNGGEDLGPRPIEMLLHCAAACTSVDAVLMLKAKGAEISDYEVLAEGTRGPEAPKPIEKMHLHYRIRGRNMTNDMIREVLELSFNIESGVVNTYRSMVTWSFDLIDE